MTSHNLRHFLTPFPLCTHDPSLMLLCHNMTYLSPSLHDIIYEWSLRSLKIANFKSLVIKSTHNLDIIYKMKMLRNDHKI